MSERSSSESAPVDVVDTTDENWPDGDALPRARAQVAVVKVDRDLALYDELGHMLIMLNSSAAALWERCDGKSTFESVVGDLARSHSASSVVVRSDARSTLQKLASLGLVTDARTLSEPSQAASGVPAVS